MDKQYTPSKNNAEDDDLQHSQMSFDNEQDEANSNP
jgi:hypothetical protein